MTDEQIRLYAIARCIVPSGTRIRTLSETTSNGHLLYTLELQALDVQRWFAVHHNVLVPGAFPDSVIAGEVRRALERPTSPVPRG